jgi:hypothetical protein
MTGTVERKDIRVVVMAPPATPPTPKPAPEVFMAQSPYGQVCRWGRREIALFDCHQVPCDDQATYWTTRAHPGPDGKLVTTKGAYCGRHFRQWSTKWMPPQQLDLFGGEISPPGP